MRFEALKVGELARRTGLTVRTLHHYDAIGLLRPSLHTEAGYRLYTAGDIARLQQVISLRQLGFGWTRSGTAWTAPASRRWRSSTFMLRDCGSKSNCSGNCARGSKRSRSTSVRRGRSPPTSSFARSRR